MQDSILDFNSLEAYDILTLAKMLEKASLDKRYMDIAAIAMIISKKAMCITADAVEHIAKETKA